MPYEDHDPLSDSPTTADMTAELGCGKAAACVRLSLRSGTERSGTPHDWPDTLTVWIRRTGTGSFPDRDGGRSPRPTRGGGGQQSGLV